MMVVKNSQKLSMTLADRYDGGVCAPVPPKKKIKKKIQRICRLTV